MGVKAPTVEDAGAAALAGAELHRITRRDETGLAHVGMNTFNRARGETSCLRVAIDDQGNGGPVQCQISCNLPQRGGNFSHVTF